MVERIETPHYVLFGRREENRVAQYVPITAFDSWPLESEVRAAIALHQPKCESYVVMKKSIEMRMNFDAWVHPDLGGSDAKA